MALMGLGYQSVVQVKTDEFSRMDPPIWRRKSNSATRTASRSGGIVATAGTTDAGAIDPLRAIAELAAKQNIWVHVDAAGRRAADVRAVSSLHGRYRAGGFRHRTSHKQFFQTISCGAFLLKEARH